jgi:predicted  nucleic acid-binding Zn-ribbon protein
MDETTQENVMQTESNTNDSEEAAAQTMPESFDDTLPDQNNETDENGEAKRSRGRPRGRKSNEDDKKDEKKDAKLKMQISKLQLENKTLKKQNEKHIQNIAVINTKCASLEIENSNLISELDKIRNENEERNKLLEELDQANQLLMDSELELSRVKLQLTNSDKQRNASIKEVDDLKTSLKKQLNRFKQESDIAQRENAKLKEKMDDLLEQKTKLNTDLSDKAKLLDNTQSELARLTQLLDELEQEKSDLLEHLDASSHSLNASSSCHKPYGLAIIDSSTEAIFPRLNSNVQWQSLSMSTDELTNISQSQLERADIILYLIGGHDIQNGKKGRDVYEKLNVSINRASQVTSVYVAEVPPTNKRGALGQVTIANYKISKMDGIHFISTNPKGLTKDEMLSDDDSLTERAISTIAGSINTSMKIPSKLKTHQQSYDFSSQPASPYKVMELVRLKSNQIGLIIGQKGATITRLCKEHAVAMKIGKWSEPSRGKEMEERMDGVLIDGMSNNVRSAVDAVNTLLKQALDKH